MLVLFALTATNLFSQDAIFTKQGDTLNCKIKEVKADSIAFKQDGKAHKIAMSNVQFYELKHFRNKAARSSDYTKIVTSYNVGYGHVFIGRKQEPYYLEEHRKKLRSGFNFGAELTGYVSPFVGFGVASSLLYTSNHLKDELQGVPIDYEDKRWHWYVAPMLSIRPFGTRFKNDLLINLSAGYYGFMESSTRYEVSYRKKKGGTLGGMLGVGYDYWITKKIGLGAQLSLLAGVLDEYEVYKEPVSIQENKHNLTRVSLSIGLRIR